MIIPAQVRKSNAKAINLHKK